jgi:hypothetical protein
VQGQGLPPVWPRLMKSDSLVGVKGLPRLQQKAHRGAAILSTALRAPRWVCPPVPDKIGVWPWEPRERLPPEETKGICLEERRSGLFRLTSCRG